MRRTIGVMAVGALLAVGMIAPASAQPRGPSGADGTYNCDDFDTQAEAREYLDEGDTHGLDSNGDGVPCEDLPPGETVDDGGSEEPETTEEPASEDDGTDSADGPTDPDDEPAEEVAAPTGTVDAGSGGLLPTDAPMGVYAAMIAGLLMASAGAVVWTKDW